mgnify:CR=1 FL=1
MSVKIIQNAAPYSNDRQRQSDETNYQKQYSHARTANNQVNGGHSDNKTNKAMTDMIWPAETDTGNRESVNSNYESK